MGQKLFKIVLLSLDEDVSNKSVIDIFSRLEQLGGVRDYETWKSIRESRNELAHEYENNDTEVSQKLEALIKAKKVIEKYLFDIFQFIKNKNLLPSDLTLNIPN